jgi:hypothetical protein
MGRLRPLGAELRDLLVRGKRSADAEIRSYPTPIPRCDAQFNYVYEQRARLTEWLNRVSLALDGESDGVASELIGALAEFAASEPVGESAEEQDLRRRIAMELARPETGAGARAVRQIHE